MKRIRKSAEFVAYTIYQGERLNEWRCPNKKCRMGVSEDSDCCPHCGQKIKFREPPLEILQSYEKLLKLLEK